MVLMHYYNFAAKFLKIQNCYKNAKLGVQMPGGNKIAKSKYA